MLDKIWLHFDGKYVSFSKLRSGATSAQQWSTVELTYSDGKEIELISWIVDMLVCVWNIQVEIKALLASVLLGCGYGCFWMYSKIYLLAAAASATEHTESFIVKKKNVLVELDQSRSFNNFYR